MSAPCRAHDCRRQAAFSYGNVALCEAHARVMDTGRELTKANNSLFYVRKWAGETLDNATDYLAEQISEMEGEFCDSVVAHEAAHNAALIAAGDVDEDS